MLFYTSCLILNSVMFVSLGHCIPLVYKPNIFLRLVLQIYFIELNWWTTWTRVLRDATYHTNLAELCKRSSTIKPYAVIVRMNSSFHSWNTCCTTWPRENPTIVCSNKCSCSGYVFASVCVTGCNFSELRRRSPPMAGRHGPLAIRGPPGIRASQVENPCLLHRANNA